MKTGNTQSPSRQPAATTGGPGRLSKYIASGILTALVLAVFLTGQLQAPQTAHAHDYGNVVCSSTRGESCPLIFLSSTKRNAESTDTALYNSFGQDLAAADHADIHHYPKGKEKTDWYQHQKAPSPKDARAQQEAPIGEGNKSTQSAAKKSPVTTAITAVRSRVAGNSN